MAHTEPTDEIRSAAALYSLGALSLEETREFEQHLAAGCEVCRAEVRAYGDVAADLPLATAEVQPPPDLRRRVLERIAEPAPRMHVVRHTEGKWRPTPFPGVSAKTLYFDPATSMVTNLLKLEPGASYPPHRHAQVEQCLVIEGDIRLDDVVLGPGDYSRNDALSDHDRIQTRDGCLLLIISCAKDELLG